MWWGSEIERSFSAYRAVRLSIHWQNRMFFTCYSSIKLFIFDSENILYNRLNPDCTPSRKKLLDQKRPSDSLSCTPSFFLSLPSLSRVKEKQSKPVPRPLWKPVFTNISLLGNWSLLFSLMSNLFFQFSAQAPSPSRPPFLKYCLFSPVLDPGLLFFIFLVHLSHSRVCKFYKLGPGINLLSKASKDVLTGWQVPPNWQMI